MTNPRKSKSTQRQVVAKVVEIPHAKKRIRSDIREKILDAGLRSFSRDGYDGASLTRIATEAGTRHPVILYHFGTKEGLWREVMAHVFQHLEATYGTFRTLTKDLDSLSILKLFIRAFVQFSAQYPERIGLILNELRGDTTRLEWLTDRYIQPLHNQFGLVVSRAVADGYIKPIPQEHLAHLMIGGGSTFFASRPLLKRIYGIDSLDPKAVAAHTEWLLESLLDGLRIRDT